MERKEYQSLGDVLRMSLQENSMQSRLDEVRAVECWHSVIGADIAAKCMKPYVSKGVMTVKVNSAPLRQELAMHRSRIAAAINRQLGKNVISEVRLL